MSVGVSVYPHHKTMCVCEVGVLSLFLGFETDQLR
jgi:hypothetical protein